jgi:hypothetical protein
LEEWASQRIHDGATWRDAKLLVLHEGTNEINRMLSVGMLIKKSNEGHVDLLGPASKVQEELMEFHL